MVQGKQFIKPSKNNLKRSWQSVKLKGNVISDDVGGLEGLIGLEVLEKYDKNLVTKAKKPKKSRESQVVKVADEQTQTKIKKKTKMGKRNIGRNQIPGQFVLLKPPSNDPAEEDKPEDIEQNDQGLSIDNLEGWNGLGVPEPILRAISENGFKSPTAIQSLTLPAAIMGKKDILGAAETGSGKTLAFGIPILAGILELKKKDVKTGVRKVPKIKQKPRKERENLTPPPEELQNCPELKDENIGADPDDDHPLYALILTPTRELAVQVRDHIASVARYTGIQVAAIFGGLAAVKQERILKRCPEIVVATPGRLWELLGEGNSHLNKIDNISFLVIDETDRMVEKGHFDELRLLLNRLNFNESKKQCRQNFVFSATLTLVHDLPEHLQSK